jgi:hypothetical protein
VRSNERGRWRNIHNKKLLNPWFSPNIISMITSWKKRWEGHETTMRWINATNIVPENLKERDRTRLSLEDNVNVHIKGTEV